MKQHQDDFKAPICNVQLSFVPSKQMQEFLSSSYTMCSVKVDKSKYEVTFPEILYPVSSTQQSCTGPANKVVAAAGKIESERQRQGVALTQLKGRERSRAGPANKVVAAAGKRESARQRVALTQLKGRKLTSYNVKLSDDRYECNITGMAAITNDGRRLLVDHDNNKVKLFSPDMKLLSSLSLSDPPRDIAVLSDQEAVVTTVNRSLVLLDISGRHMYINDTTRVFYDYVASVSTGRNLQLPALVLDLPLLN